MWLNKGTHSKELMRCFIAIDFSSSVNREMSDICFDVPRIRWVPEEQRHLTIQFLPEVTQSQLKELSDSLSEVTIEPFSLTLKGVGVFPPRKPPRVLWIGVEKNSALTTLYTQTLSIIQALTITIEKRKFTPHVTLGRFKHSPTPNEIIPFLSRNNLFELAQIPITTFHVYQSILTPTGAEHTVVESYLLE